MFNYKKMIVVKTGKELLGQLEQTGKAEQVGFVPTMGALHRGHLELVARAVSENPVVVVSIFVNPTQFNDPDDLKLYPRNLELDLKLLADTGCYLVFVPEPEEIYPETDTRKFNFGLLDEVMEGKHRPGHFNGVAQVVSKLFNLVKPRKAYFGLKDFQQLAIIKALIKKLDMPVEIVPCEIVREKSGLAMSSRNELLSPYERNQAALVYQTLRKSTELAGEKTVKELIEWVINTINNSKVLNVEYFEIIDDETFQHVVDWSEKGGKAGCVAVKCGKIRLIDNIRFN
jgi:pantoate--beta-alanine ligase